MHLRPGLYLRALAVVGGVLLGASVFLSATYAVPPLAAAACVIFADTRSPGILKSVVAMVPASAMVVAIVLFVTYGYPWGIPGAALILVSAVWAMMRRRVPDAQNTTQA